MFKWDVKYSVGISIIDEEHRKFIDIINKAIVARKQSDNPEKVKEVLNKMTDYALTHFKTEEIYMKEFNYPEYKDHREEHRDFIIKTIAYLDKVIKGDYQIANEILEHLKQHLVNHIQVTDKYYVGCFKENGLK
jgi:hemerythrin